jgi:BirA family biotin operon repressor/biotin-[acetyl-CoA-carboxylase] ligase
MDRVALIKAIAEGPVSGEALAARFGVSRAMVWKDIEALRAEGLGISSKSGYTLESAAGFGEATLSWRCGRPVTFLPATDSTNIVARRLARQGEQRAVVVADYQTASCSPSSSPPPSRPSTPRAACSSGRRRWPLCSACA